MATPSVLAFDAEGRAIDFDVWVDNLQLFLQCDRADGLSLFDLTSGASPPLLLMLTPLFAHSGPHAMLLHVLLCVATCLPLSGPLPLSLPTTLTVDLLEKALLAAENSIVAVGASRGDPLIPIFEGVPPPPFCPLLPLLLRPTSLGLSRSVRRLPLAGDAALARARGAGALEELAGAVEAAVEAAEGVGWRWGVVAGVEVSVAAVEAEAAAVACGAEVAEVAAVEEAVAEEVELVGVALCRGSAPVVRGGGTGPCTYVLRTGDRAGEQCGGAHSTQRCFGRLTDAWRHQFPEATEIPRWVMRVTVTVFFPPGLGIETAALGTGEAAALGASEAAALGASASASSGAGESALS
ncbi:unnamed protein product, partial [Closterium sp. NIES-64]